MTLALMPWLMAKLEFAVRLPGYRCLLRPDSSRSRLTAVDPKPPFVKSSANSCLWKRLKAW